MGCTVLCRAQLPRFLGFFFSFPLPVWERLAFSLNGNYEKEQKGHSETKAAFAGFDERLQVSRLGVLLQEI